MPIGFIALTIFAYLGQGCKTVPAELEKQISTEPEFQEGSQSKPADANDKASGSLERSSNAKQAKSPSSAEASKTIKPKLRATETPLDCELKTVCPRLLRPAFCTTFVRAKNKEFSASATNECAARQKLRKILCVFGENPDSFHISCQPK